MYLLKIRIFKSLKNDIFFILLKILIIENIKIFLKINIIIYSDNNIKLYIL